MDSHAGRSDRPIGNALTSSEKPDNIEPGKESGQSAATDAKGTQDDLSDASSTDGLLLTALMPRDEAGTITAEEELHAKRIAKDTLLFEELVACGFAGPVYEFFQTEFVSYGFALCMAWIGNGKMHKECDRIGWGVGEFPTGVELQDRRDLATDVAVEGVVLFREKALIGKGWSPTRGATMKTYYTNSCVRAYPDIYRRWSHRRQSSKGLVVTQRIPEGPHPGPENHVPDRLLIQQLRRHLGEKAYQALDLKSQGYKVPQIAVILDIPVKAAENLIRRSIARARAILLEMGGLGD